MLTGEKYYNNYALAIGDQYFTYKQLFDLAKKLSCRLLSSSEDCCLIIANRNICAYVGILAALISGKAYIFLSTKDSIEKLRDAIELSASRLLVADLYNKENIEAINKILPFQLDCVMLDRNGYPVNFQDLNEKIVYPTLEHSYKYAYVMFTSGSTGKPKGVPITHYNLKEFLRNVIHRVQPNNNDKFSHINELTFDFSVYEIFTCWMVGACLCVLPENQVYNIDKYIHKYHITFWSSVPSVVTLLRQLKKLSHIHFNTIRYSVFCGEALTHDTALLWKAAAPNTIIDNLYGPTEATVAMAGYIWSDNDEENLVSLGAPFLAQGIYLVDDEGAEVAEGEVGEAYLYGSQVANSYWKNSVRTAEQFTSFNGKFVYKTGDLMLYKKNFGYVFKGRKDDQLKINGYRVEKLDIENQLKSLLKTQSIAISVRKDEVTGNVNSLVCFFSGIDFSSSDLEKICRKSLPSYMIPNVYMKLDTLPYNKNGKIDYSKLKQLAI